MPSHKGFEFCVKTVFGIPLVMTRHAVPAQYGGPGDWEWTRWRPATLGNWQYANEKLRELNKK